MSAPSRTKALVAEIKLRTIVSDAGHPVVRFKPVNRKRKQVDVVRITNANTEKSGLAITVRLDAKEARRLFDPIPAAKTVLEPRQFVDWRLKEIDASTGINFNTIPAKESGGNSSDIHIER
ncbi:MAG: hypothetical protein FJW40_05115 [Acidobacteria bacterium]|nr:hypothetical protein [Acidobacteriota bacterium]